MNANNPRRPHRRHDNTAITVVVPSRENADGTTTPASNHRMIRFDGPNGQRRLRPRGAFRAAGRDAFA